MRFFQRILDSILDLLFPKRCVGCRLTGLFLCESCLSVLPHCRRQRCPCCLRPSDYGAVCPSCRGQWSLDGLWVKAPYSQKSILQKAIQTMKYHHGKDLAKRLGYWLANGVKLPFDEAVAVPVPLHVDRERERGYNQSQLLAEALPWPIQMILKRHRFTPPQAQLSRVDRLKNIKNSFSVSHSSCLVNKKCILIDDVCSTGATLNECASILKANGAETVWAVVLARAS